MANRKPPIKNQILEDYLISSSHDIKSIGGLLVSGVISTFGVYSVIKPFFDGVSTLNIALLSFVMVLIIFDTIKRGSLTKFFNSLLKKKIICSKLKKGYLVISVFATLFMVLLDGLGSWSTAEKGATLYTQFKTNSSTEYQILQQNAESGKATAQNYKIELEAWQQSKSDAYQVCNEKWHGWKAKYKAKCKEEWNTANPMPKQTTDGQIKIDEYQSIKSKQQGFLDEYLFTILFVLLALMTLLMQYLTIAKIYDDYNEIEESLTFERIQFINDTIQEHETIVAEHEQKTAEMMANATREKKVKDRKFQEIGEAIAITHKQKMNDTRAETVKRIANNVYVPTEEAKAGFVHNPFGGDDTPQPQNKEPEYKRMTYVQVMNGEVTSPTDSYFPKQFREWKLEDNEHYLFVNRATNQSVKVKGVTTELTNFIGETEHKGILEAYRVGGTSNRYLFNMEVGHKSVITDEPKKTDEEIIKGLWRAGKENEIKAGEKLTPKTQIINTNKRKEVEQMTKVYKTLVGAGYVELRGNRGYFALVDFGEIEGNAL